MNNDTLAKQLVDQYRSVIKNVAASTVSTFAPNVEYDEARQQAMLFLMSYAGILPGWHNNSLTGIEAATHPRALLATQLRLDLRHHFGNQLAKTQPTYSLDEIIEKEADPLDEYLEDRIIERIDGERDLYSLYPYLAMHVLDDLDLNDIAVIMNVSESTVDRRMADEKYRFASAMIDRREELKAA